MKRFIVYLLGLGLFATLIYVGGGSISSLLVAFKPNALFLFLHFLFTAVVFLISALRWGYITRRLAGKRDSSYFDYWFYHTMGVFTGQFVSQVGGDLFVRPAALRGLHGVPFDKGLTAAIIDRSLDLILMLSLLGPAFLYILDVVSMLNAVFIILVLVTFLFILVIAKGAALVSYVSFGISRSGKLLNWILSKRTLTKQRGTEPSRSLEGIECLSKQSLIFVMSLTLARYLFLFFRVYFLSKSFDLGISPVIFFMGTPITQLGVFLAFTPGALGILEGGWYAVLALSGIPTENITAFLIGQRVYLVIFINGVFAISYLIFGARRLILQGRGM